MNDSGAGVLGIVAITAVATGVGSLWLTAWLLAGGDLKVATADAVLAMVLESKNAPEAWGLDRSQWQYWATFVAIVAAAVVSTLVLYRLLIRAHWGTRRRERLGSETETRLAEIGDLETLWTKWGPSGRFLIGKTMPGRFGFGSKLLAAEWKADPNRRRLSRTAKRRVNDRGAVLILGPSRSGKSATTLSGILNWKGPVLLSSVKDDLIGPTLAHRRRCGEVAVFDPAEYLSESFRHGNGSPAWDERLRVSWSPLRDAHTFVGAGRAAQALAEAGPESADGQNAMWVKLAASLLRGLLFVAASNGASMRSVVTWVEQQDQPGANGDEGKVWALLEPMLTDPDAQLRRDALAAHGSLQSVWTQSDRIVSSVYTTAVSLVEGWNTPAIADSASGRSVDLEWLCSGDNSVYLVADPRDAKRLSPVFGGMVNDVLSQCFAKVARDGKPIDPPLLVVLDEAGNLPLERLPMFASTVAGLGVQLVTVWQAMSQIQELYGPSADTVIANHLTKVFYTSQSDDTTLDYAEKLGGEEEVETTVNNTDKWRLLQGSTQLQGTRLGLIPRHVIRMMPKDHALLVHGSLLPAFIRAVPWYENRKLVAGTKWNEGDDQGLPSSLTSHDEWDDEWEQISPEDLPPLPEGATETVPERPSPLAQLGLVAESTS